jgi:tetratricopeptide (TPR) repeat protein
MKLFRQPKSERLNYKSGIAKKRDRVAMQDSSVLDLEVFPEKFTKLCIEGSNAYRKNGELDKASALFDKGENTFAQAVRIAPEVTGLYREFAIFYLVTNAKLTEAKELAERAVSLEGSAKSYFLLFNILYRNSDLSGAFEALEKAVELDPDNLMYKQKFEEMNRDK